MKLPSVSVQSPKVPSVRVNIKVRWKKILIGQRICLKRKNWSPSSTPDRPPNPPSGASDVGHGMSVLQGSGGRSSVPGFTLHFPSPVFGLTISTTLSTEREPSPQVVLHSLRLKKVFVWQGWPRMPFMLKKGSGLSVSSVKAPRNRMIWISWERNCTSRKGYRWVIIHGHRFFWKTSKCPVWQGIFWRRNETNKIQV